MSLKVIAFTSIHTNKKHKLKGKSFYNKAVYLYHDKTWTIVVSGPLTIVVI